MLTTIATNGAKGLTVGVKGIKRLYRLKGAKVRGGECLMGVIEGIDCLYYS